MEKNYADVLESYLIAEEGLGMELLSALGAGIGALLKKLAIMLGVTVGFCSLLILSANANNQRVQKRLANPTIAEKQSRENYTSSWIPKILEFQKAVQEDINKLDKKNDIKKYLYDPKFVNENDLGYGAFLAGLDYSKIQYPDADGDDEPDEDKAKDFSKKLVDLKPLVQKWKNEAKIFSPYFEIVIDVDDHDESRPWIWISLSCKWVDKDGIIKPRLPKFEDK